MLRDGARQRGAEVSRARFTPRVRATPVGDLLTWDEGETKDVAHRRAQSAAAELERQGIVLMDVKVGDSDPVLAVDDEFLAGSRYDAIVISTFPPGISRWIKMDVVSRLQRKHPRVRVIHVVADDPQTAAS